MQATYSETVSYGSVAVFFYPAEEDTILSVEFKENAPCAGFDPTLDPPWLMVPLPAGGNNKAKAEITPAASAGNVDFESAAVAKATVAPATASGSPETVTVTSVAKGETEVRAKVGAAECATMGISVKGGMHLTTPPPTYCGGPVYVASVIASSL